MLSWHGSSPVASPAALTAPPLVLKVAAVVGEVGPPCEIQGRFSSEAGSFWEGLGGEETSADL